MCVQKPVVTSACLLAAAFASATVWVHVAWSARWSGARCFLQGLVAITSRQLAPIYADHITSYYIIFYYFGVGVDSARIWCKLVIRNWKSTELL